MDNTSYIADINTKSKSKCQTLRQSFLVHDLGTGHESDWKIYFWQQEQLLLAHIVMGLIYC